MDDSPNPASFEVDRSDLHRPEPVEAEEGRLRRGDSAASAFTLIAGSALAQIAANGAVLRDARRLEAVHQLRVGLRRLRGALSLFAPMLAGDGLERVKTELKWMTGELNDARNLDVFIAETFRPAARRHRDWTGMAAFGKALLAAQTRAYDRAQVAARSARFGVLMLETAAWVESGDWRQNADRKSAALRARSIAKLAPELLEDSLRKVLKRGRRIEKLDADSLHKLRLHAKRLRYATGFFADLYTGHAPRAHARFDKAMKALQADLGGLTDIATARALAAEVVGAGHQASTMAAADATAAFAAGLVAAHRAGGEAEVRAAAFKAYRSFERAQTFW